MQAASFGLLVSLDKMSHSNKWRKILRGILLLIGLHGIAFMLAIAIALLIYALVAIVPTRSDNQALFILLNGYTSLLFMMVGIGVFQLFYVIPVILVLLRERRYATVKGVVIGAALTLVFNIIGIRLFLTIPSR
jgi:heme A synthase